MRHVFVETNWVVACAAPAHHKIPAALELLDRAAAGDLQLYLPVICLSEARRPILERFQSRNEADRVRQFLLWARDNKFVDAPDEEVARRVLDQMEGRVKADLDRLDETLENLKAAKGLQTFNLSQPMLERCASLSQARLDLQPFDQAILAAILVRAEELHAEGIDQIDFCELDAHLEPWDKDSRPKKPLTEFYEKARIWVYGDFLLQAPEKPHGWPSA
jgi:predicted nucleic acid-binding protein